TFMADDALSREGYMLVASHWDMDIEGLLCSRFYSIELRHLTVAAIWILHNDIIDYVFGMMPRYGALTEYMDQIGYFTFWLSIITIILAYYVTVKRQLDNHLK